MFRGARFYAVQALAVFTVLRLAAQPMELDPAFAPRVDSGESVITSVKYAPVFDGQILVFGHYDRFYVDEVRPQHALARLLPDGRVDAGFARQLDPSVNETVQDAVTLPDGRILVSLHTTRVTPAQGRVVRLLSNGQIDPTFAPSTFDGVPHLALAADGGVFVWGHLGPDRRIVRLLADGSVDGTFTEPDFVGGMYGEPEVTSLAITSDESLVINLLPHTSRFGGSQLHRIKRTGEIDGAFVPPEVSLGASMIVGSPDNRVLVRMPTGTLLRLNADGTIDSTFAARIVGARSINSARPLPGGRVAVEAVTEVAGAGVTSVFVLQSNGAVELDCRTLPGAERIQILFCVLNDGRLVIGQGRLARTRPHWQPDPVAIMDEPTLCVIDPTAGTLTPWPTMIDSSRRANVTRLALDADGRILAEGNFRRIAGARRPGRARFNLDRTLDASFVPVDATPLFHLPDGRVIARRTTLGPADADGFHDYVVKVVRLNADGTLDPTFVATEALNLSEATWLGVATDGRILVVENASGLDSTARLAWLAPDGSSATVLSTTFPRVDVQPGAPTPRNVTSVAILPDGKLLLGVVGVINGRLTEAPVRLNADGSTDLSYQPNVTPLWLADYSIPLPDGRAYTVGPLAYGEVTDPLPVLRLNADGSPDTIVAPALAYGVQLTDGSFLYRKQRFHADGTRDLNYAFPIPQGYQDHTLRAAVLAGDGSIWIGGTFTGLYPVLEGQQRGDLARLVPAEVEGFTVPPASQDVFPGFAVTFHAELGTAAPATFQWTHDGTPIAGANQHTLHIDAAGPSTAGDYRLIATVGAKTYTSLPGTLTLRSNNTRVVNFSARSVVAPGYSPQIGGFILRGNSPRRVLLRAVGRGLPLDDPGVALLPEPVLTLHESGNVVAHDAGGARAPAIVEAGRPLGATAVRSVFPPDEPTRDSALLNSLPAGIYTAHTGSGDGRAGISVFEFYDADTTAPTAAVANVSVRGRAAPGHDVLIAGFVVAGDGALRVLIRGAGPALEPAGVPDFVGNPQLTLYNQSEAMAANDDWNAQVDVADVVRAVERAGATAFPNGSRDAAMLVTLAPGIYTVHGRDADGLAGEMVIELCVLE